MCPRDKAATPGSLSDRGLTRLIRMPSLKIVSAVCVTLVAWAWLDHINPAFPITDDGVRDQLLARDCVELGRCRLIGASASVTGFHHGAAWIDLLAAVRLLGGGTVAARRSVLWLLALSVGTLFVTVW